MKEGKGSERVREGLRERKGIKEAMEIEKDGVSERREDRSKTEEGKEEPQKRR